MWHRANRGMRARCAPSESNPIAQQAGLPYRTPRRSWLVRGDDPAALSKARSWSGLAVEHVVNGGCSASGPSLHGDSPAVADERGGAGAAPGRGRIDVFSRDCGYLFGVSRAGVSSTAVLRV